MANPRALELSEDLKFFVEIGNLDIMALRACFIEQYSTVGEYVSRLKNLPPRRVWGMLTPVGKSVLVRRRVKQTVKRSIPFVLIAVVAIHVMRVLYDQIKKAKTRPTGIDDRGRQIVDQIAQGTLPETMESRLKAYFDIGSESEWESFSSAVVSANPREWTLTEPVDRSTRPPVFYRSAQTAFWRGKFRAAFGVTESTRLELVRASDGFFGWVRQRGGTTTTSDWWAAAEHRHSLGVVNRLQSYAQGPLVVLTPALFGFLGFSATPALLAIAPAAYAGEKLGLKFSSDRKDTSFPMLRHAYMSTLPTAMMSVRRFEWAHHDTLVAKTANLEARENASGDFSFPSGSWKIVENMANFAIGSGQAIENSTALSSFYSALRNPFKTDNSKAVDLAPGKTLWERVANAFRTESSASTADDAFEKYLGGAARIDDRLQMYKERMGQMKNATKSSLAPLQRKIAESDRKYLRNLQNLHENGLSWLGPDNGKLRRLQKLSEREPDEKTVRIAKELEADVLKLIREKKLEILGEGARKQYNQDKEVSGVEYADRKLNRRAIDFGGRARRLAQDKISKKTGRLFEKLKEWAPDFGRAEIVQDDLITGNNVTPLVEDLVRSVPKATGRDLTDEERDELVNEAKAASPGRPWAPRPENGKAAKNKFDARPGRS